MGPQQVQLFQFRAYQKIRAKRVFYTPCGVMVIVVGNGHDDTSSNPRRG